MNQTNRVHPASLARDPAKVIETIKKFGYTAPREGSMPT